MSAASDDPKVITASDKFLKLCVLDALMVADYQDEQWHDDDTADLVVKKFKRLVELEYVKE